MNWLDSTLKDIKETIAATILSEKNEDKKTEPATDKNQEQDAEDEAVPVEIDTHVEAIHVPGVWKQDPNEIRWADLESKKKNSEIIKMICTLK